MATSADHGFCGPRLVGLVMERSNSCGRIGGHPGAVHHQIAAFVLFLVAHVGVFVEKENIDRKEKDVGVSTPR